VLVRTGDGTTLAAAAVVPATNAGQRALVWNAASGTFVVAGGTTTGVVIAQYDAAGVLLGTRTHVGPAAGDAAVVLFIGPAGVNMDIRRLRPDGTAAAATTTLPIGFGGTTVAAAGPTHLWLAWYPAQTVRTLPALGPVSGIYTSPFESASLTTYAAAWSTLDYAGGYVVATSGHYVSIGLCR
jgi:hypothetical protein